MAKAPATAAPSPFKLELGDAPPKIERLVGGKTSPYTDFMAKMPAPKGGKYASFFVPVGEIPATITDATQREQWAKDEQRKISNRVSGIARRLTKDSAGEDGKPTVAFAIRSQKAADGTFGVRVYRTDPAASEATS